MPGADQPSVERRGEGIVLRPCREDDAESVYLACQDPETLRWIPLISTPYSRADAQAGVKRLARQLGLTRVANTPPLGKSLLPKLTMICFCSWVQTDGGAATSGSRPSPP